MTKATPRGYIDIIENKKGITYRAKVRVRDKDRPTGYYEKNATFNTLKKQRYGVMKGLKK